MAANGEKRDPVTHRTLSQMRKHGRSVERGGEQTKLDRQKRAARNTARRKSGLKVGDPRDAAHKSPLKNAKTAAGVKRLNTKGNVMKQAKSKNRGHGMSKGRKR